MFVVCTRKNCLIKAILTQSSHKIPQKRIVTLNYPEYINVCSNGIFLLRIQKRFRNSRGKRVIGARAPEVLPYIT